MRSVVVLGTIVAIFATVGCTKPAPVAHVAPVPAWDQVHAATLHLSTPGSSCSGTAVGTHWILTAAHCLSDKNTTIKVGDQDCTIAEVVTDHRDHVLLHVHGCTFTHTAKLGEPAQVGDAVFIWGNPIILVDILRVGRVAGVADGEMPKLGKVHAQLSDLHVAPGDSGSAIFNMGGEIVAVLSICTVPFELAGSFPLAFTPEQWARLG